MSKINSVAADGECDQPQGESAAVRTRTDTASNQDAAKTDTIEPAEGDVTEPTDRENAAPARASGEVDAATPDGPEADQTSQGTEPATAKRRIRRPWKRSRGLNGRRGGHVLQPHVSGEAKPKPDSGDADDRSDQRDEEWIEDDSIEPSDATGPAGAKVAVEVSEEAEAGGDEPAKTKPRISWSRMLAYGLLPALALSLAAAAGFLKWRDDSARASEVARIESVAAAKESTITLLSYKSDTVEKDLDAAKSLLTGAFEKSYSQLINDVVIPGAKRAHISTTATVPAAASVSATPGHAVTLLFVNQTAAVDNDPPTDTRSSVRVTLDKIGGRWLISGFDPV